MDSFTILTSLIAAISITGAVLNAKQMKASFIVWAFANACWIFIDASRGIYAQSALYVVFICLNIYGFWNWEKIKKSERATVEELRCVRAALHSEAKARYDDCDRLKQEIRILDLTIKALKEELANSDKSDLKEYWQKAQKKYYAKNRDRILKNRKASYIKKCDEERKSKK